VDALAVLGISRSIRLILPKVLALAVVLPLLVVWTDLMALIGGMLAAYQALDIHPVRFVTTLPQVVPLVNLWLGVGKGVVFGGLIALTACHFGVRIQPNTRSMGRETTNAVVAAITEVILANAIFAIVFQGVGVE
jgi:phospholipid/cholesterol/gamma-HCH transport system permease protein